MQPAIVLVHYRTPELARDCVRALRAECAAAGLDPELVLVDNGNSAPGRALLRSLEVSVLDPGDNLGYGAGANLGIDATDGDPVLVLNPDVLVRPGCLRALLQPLAEPGDGAEIVGPRFFWDEGERLLLPPLEATGFVAELRAACARSGRPGGWGARRRWRRHARRHWTARDVMPSYSLSGALLAFTRRAWRRVGPFDPQYRLYFEEADWLERARRLGVQARYVPAARAVHLYNQSAGGEPAAPAWFAASRERFRRRRYGALGTAVLGVAERLLRPSDGRVSGAPVEGVDLPDARGPLWVEVSPDPAGFPAAAERIAQPVSEPWRLPAEIAGRMRQEALWVTVTDERGTELLRRRLGTGGGTAPAAGAVGE